MQFSGNRADATLRNRNHGHQTIYNSDLVSLEEECGIPATVYIAAIVARRVYQAA